MKTLTTKKKAVKSSVNPVSFKLIDNCDRSVLGEGRNYYMGFGFAQRKGEVIETVTPISACKDYLNDVIWTERSDRVITAHGLQYKKHDLFKDRKFGYLVIGICMRKGGSKYENYDRDYKLLENHWSRIEEFLNSIESLMNLEQRTRAFKLEENRVLLKVPMFWCESTYGISLYTLLARVALFWDNSDPIAWLEGFTAFQADVYLVKSAVPKLKKLIAGTRPKQDFKQKLDNYTIHNLGIVGYQF